MNMFPLFGMGKPTSVTCGLRVACLVYGYAWFQGEVVHCSTNIPKK